MRATIERVTVGALALILATDVGWAGPVDDELVINGDTPMVTMTAAPAHTENVDTIYSGWRYREESTRNMEQDDFDNPGMLFVDRGLESFESVEGSEGKACATCHEGPEALANIRATTPKVSPDGTELWSLENFVNDCRTTRMGAEEWKWNSDEMKNMTALLSHAGRGLPMNVAIDGAAEPYWEQGKEMYYTRFGQLELSCANCHENNSGNMIRADHLSQGQINGFPAYRLKDTALVSSHQRFVGCVRDTRAETFAPGSAEFRALELYLASRGQGLSVEGPSVRN